MNIELVIGIIERVFVTDLAGKFALEEKQCLINLIRRGEKLEKIVNKIHNEILSDEHNRKYEIPDAPGFPSRRKNIHTRIKEIIQKCFPETIKKTITIEIEGEDENILKFESKLNRIVGQINFGVRTNIKEGD